VRAFQKGLVYERLDRTSEADFPNLIAAQTVLCKELSTLSSTRESSESRLRSLLVLDQYAQHIQGRLLVAYVEGDGQLRPLHPRYLISARRLSRSFARAYEDLLEHIEEAADGLWRQRITTVLLQLFRQWQGELLLRLLRYKKRNSEQWRQLNKAYRSAQARGLENDVHSHLVDNQPASARTLKQQFIEILLLGAMNTGQFSPRELLWANDWIAHWSGLLTLQPVRAKQADRFEPNGFVLDISGAEGLKRFHPGETVDLLHLDTVPLVGAIDRRIATPIDMSRVDPSQVTMPQDGQIALLSKLRILFAPDPVQINRRDDRKCIALSVQSVSGLRHIVQAVREESQRRTAQVADTSGALDANTPTISVATTRVPAVWQVRDWSQSGCRLRGRTTDLNDVVPGSLISIREHQNAHLIVAVVRRLRRLMVDHIEIGVEHIGREPRFVKLINGSYPDSSVTDLPNGPHRIFGALYLPVSVKRPTIGIKALVVPVAAFNPGQIVTLLSSTGTHSLRLKKALEQQADFVWTTFTLIDKQEPRSEPTPGMIANMQLEHHC